jgi:hypothetical protein
VLLDVFDKVPCDPSKKSLKPVDTVAVCKSLAGFEDKGYGEVFHDIRRVFRELKFCTIRSKIIADQGTL